jgi:ketosteroid isomerase-like protein
VSARRHADDEEAIRGLIVAYAERMDAADFDGVADLFADGEFRSSRGTRLVGRDAVRGQYEAVLLYEGGMPRTMHVLGNIEVLLDADGETAASQCTFMVLGAATPDSLAPILAGRYHDCFRRIDGEWRFAERVVHPDLLGDLSGHMGRRERD